MSLSIEQLRMELQPYVADAAAILMAQCPWVEFTSARRDWFSQAHAMAVNVLNARQDGNWNWLAQVYRKEPTLQEWVNDHPEVVTRQEMTEGLYRTMQALPDDLKVRFAHPAGRAFDLLPPDTTDHDQELIRRVKVLPKLQRFLTSEGGLRIYHAQFVPLTEVV
mgnify:CR=1 FL=1